MAFGKLKGWLEGAIAQANPFDGGKTFSSAGKTVPTDQPGKWVGLQGGDQEYVPNFGNYKHGAPVQAPGQYQGPMLKVSPLVPQQGGVSVGVNNGMQMSDLGDMGFNPIQEPSYNNGQVTLNGRSFMGSLEPGYTQFHDISPPHLPPKQSEFKAIKYNWI